MYRYAEKAHLRLVAGLYFMKLLREKMFVDLTGPRQYVNLSYLITVSSYYNVVFNQVFNIPWIVIVFWYFLYRDLL